MNAVKKFFQDERTVAAFVQDEEGATAIEYGLLAALISVMIIAAATLVGTNLDLVFDRVAAALAAALAAAP